MVITFAQIITCAITFIFAIGFTVLMMFSIFSDILSVITLQTSEGFIYTIALVLALFIIFGIPFFIISFSIYLTIKLFSIALLNLSMGIKKNYLPVITTPANKYRLDVLNEKVTSLKYWNPVIELSFFIIAFYIILYNELQFPAIFALFGTLFIGVNTIVNIWIFEDLSINLVEEEKTTTVFGFVKEIKFSKNSIQLASIFSIIKFFTKTLQIETITIPIIEIEMPMISFLMKIFGGGVIIIVLLGLVGIFSWSYLLFLKRKYPKLVKDLEKKIPEKTKQLAGL
ncbi:MAG: hypothetical protein ACFFAU_12340 [Candidatus Hodarchaeota archaeon]